MKYYNPDENIIKIVRRVRIIIIVLYASRIDVLDNSWRTLLLYKLHIICRM